MSNRRELDKKAAAMRGFVAGYKARKAVTIRGFVIGFLVGAAFAGIVLGLAVCLRH